MKALTAGLYMMAKNKAIILLSAGLDSTANLAIGINKLDIVLAITFDYGQRAAKKEVECSKKIADFYKIRHKLINIPYLRKITKTSLVNISQNIPLINEKLLDDKAVTLKTAQSVWVPNRNGLFLNIAACYAEGLGAKVIIAGFNAEEAKTFPDNSCDFINAVNNALSYSTLNKTIVKSFTISMDKAQIAEIADIHKIPWQYLWPCYLGGDCICFECESCLRFMRAIKKAKLDNNKIGELMENAN